MSRWPIIGRIGLQSGDEGVNTLLVDTMTKLREGRMHYEAMGTVNPVYCTGWGTQEQNGHLFGVRTYHPEFGELFGSRVTYLLTNNDEGPAPTFAKEKRELMHSSCWEVYWEQQRVVYVRDKDLCMRRITCSRSPSYSEYADLNNVVSSGSLARRGSKYCTSKDKVVEYCWNTYQDSR